MTDVTESISVSTASPTTGSYSRRTRADELINTGIGELLGVADAREAYIVSTDTVGTVDFDRHVLELHTGDREQAEAGSVHTFPLTARDRIMTAVADKPLNREQRLICFDVVGQSLDHYREAMTPPTIARKAVIEVNNFFIRSLNLT